MKKIVIGIFVALIAILTAVLVFGNKEATSDKGKINVYVFMQTGCGYCTKAEAFFQSIKGEYGQYFELVNLNISNKANSELGDKVAAHFNETFNGTPYIIIGDQTFSGYASTYDDQIKAAIKTAYDKQTDTVSEIKGEKINAKSEGGVVVALALVSIAFVGYLIYISAQSNDLSEEEIVSSKKSEKTVSKEDKEIEVEVEIAESKKTQKKVVEKEPAKNNKTKTTTKKPATKTTSKSTTKKATTKKSSK